MAKYISNFVWVIQKKSMIYATYRWTIPGEVCMPMAYQMNPKEEPNM